MTFNVPLSFSCHAEEDEVYSVLFLGPYEITLHKYCLRVFLVGGAGGFGWDCTKWNGAEWGGGENRFFWSLLTELRRQYA